jgi:hypothetical protein
MLAITYPMERKKNKGSQMGHTKKKKKKKKETLLENTYVPTLEQFGLVQICLSMS